MGGIFTTLSSTFALLRWEKAALHGAIVRDERWQSPPLPCKARGLTLPDVAVPVLRTFQPAFSTPTYHRFCGRGLGALLTTGRRTITNILRTVRPQAPGDVSSDHRVWFAATLGYRGACAPIVSLPVDRWGADGTGVAGRG